MTILAETVYKVHCDKCEQPLGLTDWRWLSREEVTRLAREANWDIPYAGPHLCGACKDGPTEEAEQALHDAITMHNPLHNSTNGTTEEAK